jgi:hypothetical protein
MHMQETNPNPNPSRRCLLMLAPVIHLGLRTQRLNIRILPEILGLLVLLAWMGPPDSLASLVALVVLAALVPEREAVSQVYHSILLIRREELLYLAVMVADEYQTIEEALRMTTKTKTETAKTRRRIRRQVLISVIRFLCINQS